LTSFFSILPIYGFQKKLKFLCYCIVWIRDFIKKKIMQNYGFFQKN